VSAGRHFAEPGSASIFKALLILFFEIQQLIVYVHVTVSGQRSGECEVLCTSSQ